LSVTPYIEIKDLKKYYPVKSGIITHTTGRVHAVDGVSLQIQRGEVLGLVGESGCGKTTIGKILVGMEEATSGEILFQGKTRKQMSREEEKALCRKVQIIFQDPYSSLNPRKHIFDILALPMLYHGVSTKATVEKDVKRLLDLVGLPASTLGRYPHEFSGGQRQRIGIARALSLQPEFIVCDEPVSALDVSIQAQILNLLRQLQKELSLTMLFVGHGLGAVHYVSDRIAVMYMGQIVEMGSASEVFSQPAHPYTKALLQAAPQVGEAGIGTLLEGEVGSNIKLPQGCRFAPRCSQCMEKCRNEKPSLLGPLAGHQTSCFWMTEEQ